MTEKKEQKGYVSRVKGQENFINTTGLRFPTKYLSASQINTFLICPMSYYWGYVEKKREPPNAKSTMGNVGHKTLEILAELDKVDFTDKELKDYFEFAFQDVIEDIGKEDLASINEELMDVKLNLAPSLLYYCKNEFKKLNIIAQEIQVNSNLPIYTRSLDDKGKLVPTKLGELTTVGFIDFINHRNPEVKVKKKMTNTIYESPAKADMLKDLEVGDYKTGGEKEKTYFISDVQTPFYAYATGIKSIRIDNITPCRQKFKKDGGPYKNNIPPQFKVMKYQPQKRDFEHMINTISQVAVSIAHGSFPMCDPFSWKCSPDKCGHWKYCRGKHEKEYLTKVAEEKYQDII